MNTRNAAHIVSLAFGEKIYKSMNNYGPMGHDPLMASGGLQISKNSFPLHRTVRNKAKGTRGSDSIKTGLNSNLIF